MNHKDLFLGGLLYKTFASRKPAKPLDPEAWYGRVNFGLGLMVFIGAFVLTLATSKESIRFYCLSLMLWIVLHWMYVIPRAFLGLLAPRINQKAGNSGIIEFWVVFIGSGVTAWLQNMGVPAVEFIAKILVFTWEFALEIAKYVFEAILGFLGLEHLA